MKVSLIIPILNAENTINACLDSIYKQEKLPDEIFLIDNGSVDNTKKKINDFIKHNEISNITLLHETKKGAAAARNKGLQHAVGDIVAFTDSDCLPRKDWIKNMIRLYEENDKIDGIGGVSYIYNPQTISEKIQAFDICIPKIVQSHIISYKYETLFGKVMPTLNASYRMKIFQEQGYFDESFSIAGEDVDFTIRAFDNGFKILVWHPELVVGHMPRKSFPLFMKQIFQYRVALPVLIRKHFKKCLIIQISEFRIKIFSFWHSIVLTKKSLYLICILLFTITLILLNPNIIFFLLLSICCLFFMSLLTIRKHGKVLNIEISFFEAFAMSILRKVQGIVTISGRIYSSIKSHLIYL